MTDGSLEDLFELDQRESIEDLFEDAFRDLRECQRSLDLMKAGKAPTPASKDLRGLVPQGEGGDVVRIPRRQVHQACLYPLYQCGKDSPEAVSPGLSLSPIPMW